MRRNEGRETITELINWDRGQAASERLAGKILISEGFAEVDPSHPSGGPDGGKDFLLSFNGKKWVGAVYFPKGEKKYSDIKEKFKHDLDGIKKNAAAGIAFVTNQELTISERKELESIASEVDSRIYHLERIGNILDSPKMYGVRLEFLDIEMSKEEQLSFLQATQERQFGAIQMQLDEIKQCLSANATELLFDEDEVRTLEEVQEAENEFYSKIWLDRHFSLAHRVEKLGEKIDPEIWENANESAEKLVIKFGEENIGPYSDFEWGVINGKLSALRWVLGYEWDMLDT